ncbi:MAG: type II toxin-antitoxin system death-on-curing family toxin [Lachnospiraceae bacterium]|nr:type II toxin-antitoxin system death-on-curing family toxin [Lachnospiraceae bacterium]
MIVLSKEQVLKLYANLIKATGGSDGIRDEGMLDMALNNPFQSFDGKELYPSIQAKAARLCFGLLKNHAMLDGNKRLGTHVMLVFLALNGYELYYSQKELSDVILALASGDIGEKEILRWIIEHQQYLYGDFYNKTTQY